MTIGRLVCLVCLLFYDCCDIVSLVTKLDLCLSLNMPYDVQHFGNAWLDVKASAHWGCSGNLSHAYTILKMISTQELTPHHPTPYIYTAMLQDYRIHSKCSAERWSSSPL